MSLDTPSSPSWRETLSRGDLLVGTFVKTPSPAVVELLALAELDFIVIDAEHAPIGLEALDTLLLAARGLGMPALVRVPSHDLAFINSCLDAGAEGVLVPHIRSAAQARAVSLGCRYQRGVRGFSPSTRAGRYGTRPPNQVLLEADERVGFWSQIEDAQAIDEIEAICEVAEVDCLFVGRQDLALSLGVDDASHAQVQHAVGRVAEAGRSTGRRLGIFVADAGEIATLRNLGFSVFVCGSDQALLLSGARSLRRLAHQSQSDASS